jgi:hypothetical protein
MEDLLMKAATIIAVALATFSSFPSTAQQQPAQQQQQQPMQQPPTQQQEQQMQQPGATGSNAQAQQNAANMQARANADQLKPVTGELVNKLDSKSAKQGDSVVVKTSEDLKFPGGAEIPKGSKLLGHVTNVQARGDGKENSQIAIQFDRAEVKGGQDMAIESVIQSVSPAAGSGVSADNGVPGNYGAPAASSTPSGATSSAPSMSGSNGSSGSASSMNRPSMASNTTAQAGTTDQNTNSGMPAPGSIVARNGNVAIRTTAIPGVLLANDINGLPFTNASGMLLGARRDIHLDGGTQMVVAVAAAPQAAGGGMSR